MKLNFEQKAWLAANGSMLKMIRDFGGEKAYKNTLKKSGKFNKLFK